MEKKTLSELLAEANSQAKIWNTAMFEKKLDIAIEADKKLVEIEQEYFTDKQQEVFHKLANEEKPMVAAITEYSFPIINHIDKKDKESGLTTREIFDKDYQINLLRFDEYCFKTKQKHASVNELWYCNVQKFNQLLCLRTARDLKATETEIKAIAQSYYMKDKAKDISMGKTPDSNTAILKMLQSCIDEIISEKTEDGKRIYNASSHDVAYILDLYHRKGKGRLSVACANHATMQKLITDVCHRIVTNATYSIEFKKAKNIVETTPIETVITPVSNPETKTGKIA